MEVGFSLGTNLGERMDNLRRARRVLIAERGIRLEAVAPVYETEPVGVRPEHQDLKFLNTVLIVSGDLSPRAWWQAARRVENALGRIRRPGDRNAPRSMDVDLIYVGDTEMDDGGLVIPHPRWMERGFVVRPLADVRPGLWIPGAPGPVRTVLERLQPTAGVVLYCRDW